MEKFYLKINISKRILLENFKHIKTNLKDLNCIREQSENFHWNKDPFPLCFFPRSNDQSLPILTYYTKQCYNFPRVALGHYLTNSSERSLSLQFSYNDRQMKLNCEIWYNIQNPVNLQLCR